MSENKVIWHPYPQEKPIKSGQYLVTVEDTYNVIDFADYLSYDKQFLNEIDEYVIAWAELPEPYKGE